MSEELGTVELAPRDNPYLGGSGGYGGEKPFAEESARIVDSEVLWIMGECHEEARRLLTEHRKELEALAKAVFERKTLDEEEILEVMRLSPAPPLENSKVSVPDADSHA
jgi:cell division protease FtsH